ncbi:Autophagy-related protein 14 [Cladobotryum mycophilum]|uniref:Autophagy-related protein 14 n=1 Tax=Cladobotryum mycophilum TaxID=491253 RepID=A0ABR0SL29_9HYPO
MECDICHRPHDAQRQPFLCAVDARNKIYEGRMKQLELILENEALQSQINQLLDDASKPGKDAQDMALAQRYMAEQKTDRILQAADRLREEIRAAKEEIQARKASLARRRSDLASVSAGLAERRTKQQKDVEKSINMLKFRWAQGAEDMAATRAFLCTEAVRLYGLKRSSKKGSTGRYDYHLGRIPIIDLTSMDSLPPEIISTSLAHVAHILMLISHYLAIRLPAEITLPHRDYPRPTIFNLQSSYHHGDVFFPGTPVATTPLVDSPGFNSHVPRPRPLFVEKPLSQLSKEDPATYSLFLEGVTLLSYNISWLCCSQGVSVGDKSAFEDICNMGRNLYSLLINIQVQGVNNLAVNSPNANPNGSQGADLDQNWLGRYSHGTTYYFLGGPEGTELIKTFKIPNPLKLADKLKKKLIGDAPAPDWEVLDDDAWKEEGVGNGTVEPKGFSDKVGNFDVRGSPRSSSNGWMKVKTRT